MDNLEALATLGRQNKGWRQWKQNTTQKIKRWATWTPPSQKTRVNSVAREDSIEFDMLSYTHIKYMSFNKNSYMYLDITKPDNANGIRTNVNINIGVVICFSNIDSNSFFYFLAILTPWLTATNPTLWWGVPPYKTFSDSNLLRTIWGISLQKPVHKKKVLLLI